MTQPVSNSRLNVVDALRGTALLGILLLHNVLHFNLYFIPEGQPQWLALLDKGVMYLTSFFIAGKAYAVFSLLFGFSFYIQLRNRTSQGHSFAGRFVWRMFLLFLFAEFNALFYSGNILLMYAIVGLLLIPFSKFNNRIVLIAAIICLLQPLEIGKIAYYLINPQAEFGYHYLNYSVDNVMMNGSLAEAIKANITDGQICNMLYYIEKGRLFQTIGLFLIGMLLGRLNLFVKSEQSESVWKKIIIRSSILFIILFIASKAVVRLSTGPAITSSLETIFVSLSNLSLAGVMIAAFVLLWFRKKNEGYYLQRAIVPYGRMSLTNYISQSVIGVFIYYGFGLGLYQHLGATLSILVGVSIFIVQFVFTRLWLKHHKQGILEYIWKKGTWIFAKGR